MKLALTICSTFLFLLNCIGINAQEAAISLEQMNVMYRGLDNPISIVVQGYSNNEYEVICEDCQSVTGQNGKYMVRPGNKTYLDISLISKRKGEQEKLLFTNRYRVKRMPDPIIQLCGKYSGDSLYFHPYKTDDNVNDPDDDYDFSKNTNCNGGALIPLLSDFDFAVYARIKKYEISFIKPDHSIFTKSYDGNILHQEIFEIIENLPIGSKINFNNIQIILPDGTIRTSSVCFYLKK